MQIISQYQNGNCSVTLYDDGTKTREWDGIANPEYPESCDFKLTDHCGAGCPHCFESSTKRGKHGDTTSILAVVDQLMPGTEIAIGGGNPLDHPDLIQILQTLKDRGVVANLTVNSKHIVPYKPLIEKLRGEKLIYGLGISYDNKHHQDICEMVDNNTVIHVIAGVDKVKHIMGLPKICKLLVLGYKEYGFGVKYYQIRPVADIIGEWRYWIGTVMRRFHTSFDNLGIKQLRIQELLSPSVWHSHYMGNDGTFTMFLDGVTNTYAITSTKDRMAVGTKTVKEMFEHIRSLV